MDRVSKKKRSKIMRSIKSEHTKPEKAIRSSLYKRGYRFRLHLSDLPGTPDIVLRKYGVVIFVNGCFWHQHGCNRTSMPKSNSEFWKKKFDNNKKRDIKNKRLLEDLGWEVVVAWECDIVNNIEKVVNGIERKLKKRSLEEIRIKKNAKKEKNGTKKKAKSKSGHKSRTKSRRKSGRKPGRKRKRKSSRSN